MSPRAIRTSVQRARSHPRTRPHCTPRQQIDLVALMSGRGDRGWTCRDRGPSNAADSAEGYGADVAENDSQAVPVPGRVVPDMRCERLARAGCRDLPAGYPGMLARFAMTPGRDHRGSGTTARVTPGDSRSDLLPLRATGMTIRFDRQYSQSDGGLRPVTLISLTSSK